jgi:hypothetical protein
VAPERVGASTNAQPAPRYSFCKWKAKTTGTRDDLREHFVRFERCCTRTVTIGKGMARSVKTPPRVLLMAWAQANRIEKELDAAGFRDVAVQVVWGSDSDWECVLTGDEARVNEALAALHWSSMDHGQSG